MNYEAYEHRRSIRSILSAGANQSCEHPTAIRRIVPNFGSGYADMSVRRRVRWRRPATQNRQRDHKINLSTCVPISQLLLTLSTFLALAYLIAH